MPPPRRSTDTTRLATLLTVVVVIAVLYWAREVLIPLALAVLLTFLLAPLVALIQRLGIGRILSVIVVTVLAFVVIATVAYIVFVEAVELASKLPDYKDNIRAKVQALNLPKGGVFSRAGEVLEEINREVTQEVAGTQPAATTRPRAPTTVPSHSIQRVEVVEPGPAPLSYIRSTTRPLIDPLVSAGIVIVFVIFMLIRKEDLRDRIIRLIGQGRLTATTQAIDEAAERVSRYLLMQLIVNVTYGIPVAIGLWAIGVPDYLLWGVMATLFRFIPYVGPWIAASMPILLSLAVFDTWTQPALTIGLFLVLELVSNNFMEPWLYGSRTGVSSIAVLVSAVFWTWLWGPIGLILATPLTVCLVVMGRHVTQLEFLNVLLSDQPSLPPEARIYQRLLAKDQDEVVEVAEEYLKSKSLAEFYEQVLIPALILAERDRHQDLLAPDREEAVYRSLRFIIDDLGDRFKPSVLAAAQANAIQDGQTGSTDGQAKTSSTSARKPETPPAVIAPSTPQRCVLCLPAHDEGDELAAIMLGQLLESREVCVETISGHMLIGEMIDAVEKHSPSAICISALPPTAVMHSRYLCKRLTAHFPDVKIIVGLWNASDAKAASDRLQAGGNVKIVTSLTDAVEQLRVHSSLNQESPSPQPSGPPAAV